MSRYVGPKCRLCRREGEKLFLKGERCETQKCAVLRRNYAPGFHGKTGLKKPSEYAKQLREKQKLKRIFGLAEKQFSLYYQRASRKKGEVTGTYFLKLLEKRLDNVIYRAGLAPSRNAAKQMVSHGVVKLNGRTVDIPSIQAKTGDKITIKEKNKKSPLFGKISNKKDLSPKWLKADLKNLAAEVIAEPEKDDLESNIDIQMVVEYYAK